MIKNTLSRTWRKDPDDQEEPDQEPDQSGDPGDEGSGDGEGSGEGDGQQQQEQQMTKEEKLQLLEIAMTKAAAEVNEEFNGEPKEGDIYVEKAQQGNFDRAPSTFSDDLPVSDRKLMRAFSIAVDKIAETYAGEKIQGIEYWDVQQIMMRRFTGRIVTDCKHDRNRENMVLLLDDSGSCSSMSDMYKTIAKGAIARGDVDVYYAPNGDITARVVGIENGKIEKIRDRHGYKWPFDQRVCMYFTDSDSVQVSADNAHRFRKLMILSHTSYSNYHYMGGWGKRHLDRLKPRDNVDLFVAKTKQDLVRIVKKL